jgi:hypothetical protein
MGIELRGTTSRHGADQIGASGAMWDLGRCFFEIAGLAEVRVY